MKKHGINPFVYIAVFMACLTRIFAGSWDDINSINNDFFSNFGDVSSSFELISVLPKLASIIFPVIFIIYLIKLMRYGMDDKRKSAVYGFLGSLVVAEIIAILMINDSDFIKNTISNIINFVSSISGISNPSFQ